MPKRIIDKFTVMLRQFRRYETEFIFLATYMWTSLSLFSPEKLITGGLIEIAAFKQDKIVLGFIYMCIFLVYLYGMYINNRAIRKLGLLISAMLMGYFGIRVWQDYGVTLIVGMFFILSVVASLTLLRLTANEDKFI